MIKKRKKPQNVEENLGQKQNKLQLRRWSLFVIVYLPMDCSKESTCHV